MQLFRQGIIIILIFYLVTSCSVLRQPVPSRTPVPSLNQAGGLSDHWEKAENKSFELIRYARKSDAWRRWARTTFQQYQDHQKSHPGRIAAVDLVEIELMGKQYVDEIWKPLWDLMLSPFFYMDLNRDIQIQTELPSYIEKDVVRYVNSMGEVMEYEEDPVNGTVSQRVRVDVYHINPLDRKGKIFLREFEISFAAALILIDNFTVGWKPYMQNKAIRRILFYDAANPENAFRQAIQEIWRNYHRFRNSEQLVAAFNLYRTVRQIQDHSESFTPGPHSYRMTHFIERSGAYQRLVQNPQKGKFFQRLGNGIKMFFRRQQDGLNLIKVHTTHIFGKAFALSADLFQPRDGHLMDIPGDHYGRLVKTMKPLDVLLQRSRSRLTDKLIPGHYSHVGIWVGTEEELRALGLWEQLPGLYENAQAEYNYQGPPFQEAVRQGKSLIEALASGVELYRLWNFLDADDLVVLRPGPCGPADTGSQTCLAVDKQREYLLNAFRQIGKHYDFSLNFNSDSELVCSEVAYWTYVDFDIKIDQAIGKHYLRPDEIARQADDPDDPFYPVVLYVNGKRVWKKAEPLRKELKRVLADDSSN